MLRGFLRSLVERDKRRVEALREVTRGLGGTGASVVLFGSRVRGEASAASDFDLLVVSEDPGVGRRLAFELRRRGIPADVHHYTPEEARRLLPTSSVLLDALQEGEVLLDGADIGELISLARELGRRGFGRVPGGWALADRAPDPDPRGVTDDPLLPLPRPPSITWRAPAA